MNRCLAIVACLVPLYAQSWESLRGLKPGDSLRITDALGKEYRGALSASSADSLTIQAKDGSHSFERPELRVVKVRSSSRRIRNLLIGAGIGVAIGVTVDQTVGQYLRNETGDSQRALTYIAPIGLFTAVGAAIPAYRTVYRFR